MTNTQDLQDLKGQTAVDVNGAKIGKIGQIYVDDQTSVPLWVTISTGLFGSKESFAPFYGSRATAEGLQLAVTKDMVKDAPNVDADGNIDDSENGALYTYYNGYLGDTGQDTATSEASYQDRGQHAGDTREDLGGREGVQDTGVSGRAADDAMTRSEERLHVGTEQVEAGRVRLRKYVVTENVTRTVPVSHEEVRVEREPITDENRGAAMTGSDITEDEHEITLHAEQPVVSKETVPVEQVRLGKETVTEQQEVSETVRKEQIDDPDTTGDTTSR